MLACDQPRQHNQHNHHHRFHDRLPSPPSSNRNLQQTFFNRLAQSATTPSSSASNDRLPFHYFDPATAFESPVHSQLSLDSQYMSGNYNYQSPAIRVQHSTPTPGLHLLAGQQHQPQHQQQQQQQQLLPSNHSAYNQSWDSIGTESFGSNGHMVATQSLHTPGLTRARPHQRAPSASSIGSSGSASPYSQGHASVYSYAVSDGSPTVSTASKLGHNYNVDQSSRAFSNHLPTPNQTPTHDTFIAASYPNYSQQGALNSAVAAHLAMNQVIEHDTANNDEELPGMSHSARQSISDLGQEPSTPRTVAGDTYDDHYKQPDTLPRQTVPKFDRTMSDIYQDELYDPSVPHIQSQPATRTTPAKQYLSPHRNVITERLQAAEIARSQSPTTATSRGVSPFRPDSPYVQDPYMQASRFHTASQVRQRQKQQADAKELSQHQPKAQQVSTPNTISPKDAFLDLTESEEDSKTPLFADNNTAGYGQQYAGAQQNFSTSSHGQFETAPQPFGNMASSSRAENWTNPRRQGASAFSTTPATAQQQSAFNFSTNAIAGNLGALPFSPQNYRSAAAPVAMPPTKQEETPDFPAHLTSMESSASEAPPSSSNSTGSKTQKPASSLADTGTYTCTYHGCTLRFETPQKLQKHKREGHRNPATSPSSPPASASASAMTSADILARNSQAGPHKCERINPTTGKSCNTVFSRPYDLTRHEDTIHNIRKQKVRCALCVEEKTFSRNDALTRHMRVVHPEVDFPGKHRRRGANDS